MLGDGTSRVVIVLGGLAIKIARHLHGLRCNRFEADLYQRTSDRRRLMLCPVLWRSWFSVVLVSHTMARVSLSSIIACQLGLFW